MENICKCFSWIVDCPMFKCLGFSQGDYVCHQRLQKAVVTCQRAWKRTLAKRELERLKLVAKDTSVLREANGKLEKDIQGLKLQLQLEKRLRKNLLKTKANLKEALQKNQELLQQESNSADIALQAYALLQQKNENLANELQDSEKKVKLLQYSIKSFEKKLANLESENQALRLQVGLLTSQAWDDSSSSSTNLSLRTSENKSISNTEEMTVENKNLLIKCISQEIGFSDGRPIAAYVIYKSLLHWGFLEAEKTSIFDRIIQTISSAVEDRGNSRILSYWLSNSCTLLLLLQRTLKASETANMASSRRTSETSITTSPRRATAASLWSRLSHGIHSSPQSIGLLRGHVIVGAKDVHQVEAKYPALLFHQQLAAFLDKIYGIIRDNMKKDILSILVLCIEQPWTSTESRKEGSSHQSKAASKHDSVAEWRRIVKIMDNYFKTMKSYYVPRFLIRKMFTQIFSFINVQLFNSLLLPREYCSFSYGEYLRAGLLELDQWCSSATDVYAGGALEELKHIRQGVTFLVTYQKPEMTLKELAEDLCPDLDMRQLYRIIMMYGDDNTETPNVSSEVISSMRKEMTEDPNVSDVNSLLLDDDSSIPFSAEDIYSMTTVPIDLSDIEPPSLLAENPAFLFLAAHS